MALKVLLFIITRLLRNSCVRNLFTRHGWCLLVFALLELDSVPKIYVFRDANRHMNSFDRTLPRPVQHKVWNYFVVSRCRQNCHRTWQASPWLMSSHRIFPVARRCCSECDTTDNSTCAQQNWKSNKVDRRNVHTVRERTSSNASNVCCCDSNGKMNGSWPMGKSTNVIKWDETNCNSLKTTNFAIQLNVVLSLSISLSSSCCSLRCW